MIQDNHLPTYTVTYSGNGNTSGTAPIDGASYLAGATVTVANSGSLMKIGFAFAGWNTASDGSGAAHGAGTSMPMGSGNMTLYAVWTPTYTVSYSGNGNTSGVVPADGTGYLPGAVVTVKLQGTMLKSGFTFTGWNTQANGSGMTYAAGSLLTMGAGNVTLYAVWNTWRIVYFGNGNDGGTVPNDINGYAAGVQVGVFGPGSMTLSNGFFVGWNTAADGSGSTTYAPGDTLFMTVGNVNLYAMWATVSGTTLTAVPLKVTSLVIPEGVAVIQGPPFPLQNHPYLSSVTIPSTMTTIPNQTFTGDPYLLTITSAGPRFQVLNGALVDTVANRLIAVPARLFSAFAIPAGVTSIGNYAFDSCANLTSITIPASLTTIDTNAFSGLTSRIPIVLPNTVLTIDASAFVYSDFTRITIPATVTSIDASAMRGCTYLTDVYMLGSTPPALLAAGVFANSFPIIHVPNGAVGTYTGDPNWAATGLAISYP